MKKIIALLLILALTSVLFSACELNITDNSQADSSIDTSTDETSAVADTLPASAVATKTAGVYGFLADKGKTAGVVAITPCGEYLRYEFIEAGMSESSSEIYMYSPTADSIVGSLITSGGDYFINDIDNGFVIIDRTLNKAVFYDYNCNETASYDIDFGSVYPAEICVAADGKTMLYSDYSGFKLTAYDFAAEKSELVDSSCSLSVWIRYNEGLYYFEGKKGEIHTYNPEDKSVKTVSKANYAAFIGNDCAVEYDSKRFIITPLTKDMSPIETAIVVENQLPVYADGDCFITATYTEFPKLHIYDLKAKTLTVFDMPTEGNVLDATLHNGLIYVSTASNDGGCINYVCKPQSYTDVEIIPSTEPYDRYEGVEYPKNTGSAETVALADKLLETYNIRVVYSEENLAEYMQFPGFTGVAVNEETAYKAMQDLEITFRDYFPEGMFMEVTDNIPLWVFLATDLVSDDMDCAGVALNNITIALDAEYNAEYFRSICAHELMHIIDKNVDFIYENCWLYLMPEEMRTDAYYDDYGVEYDDKYTVFDNGKTDVWFFDNYARTYSTEDRARIFENLYLSDHLDKLVDGLNYDTLKKKARYMSVMIRSSFECCRDAESLPWERFIGEIDMHEFDDILAHADY